MPDTWHSKLYDNRLDVVNDFLSKKKSLGRSERTLNEYSRLLKRFFHDVFPEQSAGEIQVGHIEEYVTVLDGRECGQNTKRRYLETLSSFYSWTMKRPRFEEITGNPAAVVLEEIPKKVQPRPDCATWSKGKEIVHRVANPRDKTIVALLAKTGCRVTEALSIQMDDVMLEEGFIRLRVRKGGKQTVVPIDEEMVRAIQRYQFIRPEDKSPYLFVSIRGQRLGRERVRRVVREAAVDAGVMKEGEDRFHKKFTPHTYRTVFTTLMRNQGMKDHFTQYIRGDSESETMDIYTRVDREDARDAYLNCIKPLDL